MKLRPYILAKIKKADKKLQSNPLNAAASADFDYWTNKLYNYDYLVLQFKRDKRESKRSH